MKKVLVVDDNPVTQKILKSILNRLDVEVDIASNGALACEMAEIFKYDLIFMDCFMPVMGGLDSTHLIREMDKNTPIIGISATASEDYKLSCIKAGMNRFLPLPFEKRALLDILTNINQ